MRKTSTVAIGVVLLGVSRCAPGIIGDPQSSFDEPPSGRPGSHTPPPTTTPPNDPNDPNPELPPPSGPPPDPCLDAPVDVPVVPLQRMRGAQFLNTERAIFDQPTLDFALESGATTSITQLEAEKINDAAAALVATGGHYRYAPCDAMAQGSDACAQEFIRAFGEKAFRRPLDSGEQAWLWGVYQQTRSLPDLTPPISFQEAIDVVAQVVVQSGQHLYLSPQGVADPSLPAGLKRTTGYERATRLAYTLTNSTPDDPLLAAAASGELDSMAGLEAQAQRLLDAPPGHAIVRTFGASYAGINPTVSLPALENLPKDKIRFPFDSLAFRSAMRAETEAFFERVFYSAAGSFASLMTSTDAYVNGPLARLYGVTGGPANASTFAWVTLDPTQRAGLFTRAGFLAKFANQDYQSPIRRGVHLYRDTLCHTVPPPPPNVNTTPPAPSHDGMALLSVRQQTEQRTSPAFCTACHGQFNPVGFTLENYDAMGAWQTVDTGTTAAGDPFSVPIDSTSTILTSDLAGEVSGGIGLSQKLAQSREARDCMTRQWFSFVMGRAPATEDTCTVSNLAGSFAQTSDLHALVVSVISSAPMLYVRNGTP